jgi:hypothetical protein
MLGNGKNKVPFMAINNPSLLKQNGIQAISSSEDKAIIPRPGEKSLRFFYA